MVIFNKSKTATGKCVRYVMFFVGKLWKVCKFRITTTDKGCSRVVIQTISSAYQASCELVLYVCIICMLHSPRGHEVAFVVPPIAGKVMIH